MGVGYGLWGRRGDMVLIPLVPRPCRYRERVVGLSLLPSPGTHALCSVSLNERGFAVVELGFGATCDVT